MRRLRFLALAPILALQGCWFVFIPGSLIDASVDAATGAEGRHCISERYKPGDTIRLTDGTYWTVETVSGTSRRCQDPSFPIRARLTPI